MAGGRTGGSGCRAANVTLSGRNCGDEEAEFDAEGGNGTINICGVGRGWPSELLTGFREGAMREHLARLRYADKLRIRTLFLYCT